MQDMDYTTVFGVPLNVHDVEIYKSQILEVLHFSNSQTRVMLLTIYTLLLLILLVTIIGTTQTFATFITTTIPKPTEKVSFRQKPKPKKRLRFKKGFEEKPLDWSETDELL